MDQENQKLLEAPSTEHSQQNENTTSSQGYSEETSFQTKPTGFLSGISTSTSATPGILARMVIIELDRHMLFSGVTKSELARRIGISPQRVNKIFSGSNITLKTLGNIARALGVSLIINIDSKGRSNE